MSKKPLTNGQKPELRINDKTLDTELSTERARDRHVTVQKKSNLASVLVDFIAKNNNKKQQKFDGKPLPAPIINNTMVARRVRAARGRRHHPDSIPAVGLPADIQQGLPADIQQGHPADIQQGHP
jgi:hypothetical protein